VITCCTLNAHAQRSISHCITVYLCFRSHIGVAWCTHPARRTYMGNLSNAWSWAIRTRRGTVHSMRRGDFQRIMITMEDERRADETLCRPTHRPVRKIRTVTSVVMGDADRLASVLVFPVLPSGNLPLTFWTRTSEKVEKSTRNLESKKS